MLANISLEHKLYIIEGVAMVASRYDMPGVSAAELVRGEESTLSKTPTLPMSELYDFMTGDPYPSLKKAATVEFMRRLDLVDELLGIETVSWKTD